MLYGLRKLLDGLKKAPDGFGKVLDWPREGVRIIRKVANECGEVSDGLGKVQDVKNLRK